MSWGDFVHWMSDNYKGHINLTMGDGLDSYYGSAFRHVVGADNKLVCAPLAQILMFPPSQARPIFDCLLGLGDWSDFVYGQRVRLTYGGPSVDIRRGPSLNLLTDAAYGWGTHWPLPPQNNDAVRDMQDVTLTRLVFAFSTILNLVTTMLELWIRFKYEGMNEYTGSYALYQGPQDQEKDPSSELMGLEYSLRLIPKRLMALIYHLEVSGSFSKLGKNFVAHAKKLWDDAIPGYPLKFIALTSFLSVALPVAVGLTAVMLAVVLTAFVVVGSVALVAGFFLYSFKLLKWIGNKILNAARWVQILLATLVVCAIVLAITLPLKLK